MNSSATPTHSPSPGAASGRVIGMDLHPEIFTSAILEGQHAMHAKLTGLFDGIEMDSLSEWARTHLQAGDLVVCEAGSNSFEVIKQLEALGITAICLESQRVGQIRDSYFNDDRSSAERIARIYLSGLAKAVWVPDEKTRQHRELLGAHQDAVRQATRTKNSLRSYLTEHGLTLSKGTRLSAEKTEDLILELRDWSGTQELILREGCLAVRQAEQRRRILRERICHIISEDERMLGLMKLLGISLINAFALVAAVGDIDRFASPRKLVAFIGLAERRDKSGKSIDKKRRGGAGRKDIRSLLVQAAQAVLNSRRGGDLKKWGWKLFARKGKRAVAVVAVARKLATQAWYQLKGKTPELLEDTAPLRRKLTLLSTHLEKSFVQQKGFPTKKAFVEHLLSIYSSPNPEIC